MNAALIPRSSSCCSGFWACP